MKRTLFAVIAATTLLCGVSRADEKCGNECPGGPESCPDCPKDGANPFTPYSGSVQRDITDLELFGGVGEEKLSFRRLTTSRYKPAIPTPLGTGGSWRHSYYWNIVPNGTDPATGNEIIHVDYPDATEQDFHKTTSADLYLTGVSATQERIEQLSTDPNQYYLWFPDGRRVWFKKVVSGGTTTFQTQGLYDKYNNFYSFTLDTKNRVSRVTEPGGRYLQINYSSIGNFNVVNANFSYTDATATTVSVAGEFNGWSTSANPMTKNGGTWTASVPVQPATSYQYKFFINGQWQSGNNSLMAPIQNGDPLPPGGDPVPITFSYTSATASSVLVAGQFNNWTGATLIKSGSTWTATMSINPGAYGYKFIVDGVWQLDPANQFTTPDGLGGYNSRLVVGPLDEGITQVVASDGRSVSYSYAMYTVGGSIYSTLTRASYGDGTAGVYTYSTPTIGSRPTLASADDPRYRGPATRVSYVYQANGIEGFISTESSLVDGTVIASLAPSDTGDRSVTTGGRILQTTFAQGNLATRTDSLGRVKGYTYFNGGWGMLASSTEYNGTTPYTTSFERTAQFGNTSKTTLPDGSTRLVSYTSDTKPFFPATTTDENSKVTTYTRDTNNRPTRIDYPDGGYETFTYDNNNFNLLTSHRLLNGATESFTYYTIIDTAGKVGDIKTRTNGAGEITTFTYDAAGRVASAKDGLNNVTIYQYNDRGQMTRMTFADASYQVFGYDTYGNRTSVTNEIGKIWTKSFDQYNRLSASTDPLNRATQYVYGPPQSGGCGSCNIENYPTSISLPSGKTTTITYDTEWQRTGVTAGAGTADAATAAYGYDSLGELISMTDPRGKLWGYAYDNRKRRTRATDPNGNYTSWTYDPAGNKLTEQRSGDTTATVYAYDAVNHLTDATDQAGNHTHVTYDGAGNMLTLLDPRSNTYTFTYDGMSRKLTMVYPSGGGTEAWTYDAAGNLHTYQTRASQTETFVYDNRNRETNTSWSGNAAPAATKTYDTAGRLLTQNSTVSTVSYGYDDANELLSETQQITADGGPKSVNYTYTLDGQRLTLAYPSGSSITYGYTGRNQLNSITATGVSATYAYDLNGNVLTKTNGNGTTATYGYDDGNRLLTLAHKKGQNSLDSLGYGYNVLNDRTNRSETVNSVTTNDTYGYDPIDQVNLVKYNFNSGTNTQDRLVNYVYDPAGNRSSVTDNGVATSYTPNVLNQYTAVGSLHPTYDSNGNLTGQGQWTYTYDAMNRMTSAFKNGTTVNFAYDARNRCVSRTINGVITFYYYDGWNLIEEQNASSALLSRYVNGVNIDEIIAAVTAGVTTYYHQDALGSTVALSGSTGAVVERYGYDVYGAPTIKAPNGQIRSASSYGNRFLFTGREYIQQALIYDYRNRMYSPSFGRFFQTDPIRFGADDVNLYRYVSNGSVTAVDPTGLFGCGPWERKERISTTYGNRRPRSRPASEWQKAGSATMFQDRFVIKVCQRWKKKWDTYELVDITATYSYERTCTVFCGPPSIEHKTGTEESIFEQSNGSFEKYVETCCSAGALGGPGGACAPPLP